MRKSFLIISLGFLVFFNFAKGEITIGFESESGYSTSIDEFSNKATDYFIRTDGSNITGESFSNRQGYYFAAQDIDGEGASLPVTLTIDDINISSLTDIEFLIYIAEDDASSGEDWDVSDYVHIDYDIDNSSTFSNLIHIVSELSSGSNGEPRLDTDFDGIGDGMAITDRFTKFKSEIPGSGSKIDIKITFNLDSGDEDIALDNITIRENSSTAEPDNHVTNFSVSATSHEQIDLSWTSVRSTNIPDGYLIKANTTGTFADPTDGSDPSEDSDLSDNSALLKVDQGIESYSFTDLTEETKYYCKIWPYSNSGSDIDFKTDGSVPQDNATTDALPNTWINEIHYDNSSTDENEGIEIIIENPGNYTLSDFTVTLYKGEDGTSYDSKKTLDNFTEGTSDGSYTIYYKMISGIQNGPDGISLDYYGGLIQFLSYEGSFDATDGVADGETSEDIVVEETSTTGIDQSLQLTGNGTQYSDFSWESDLTQTFGSSNDGGDQSLPIELSSFSAEYNAGIVTLTWETASEIDNAGFNIYRSMRTQENFRKINSKLIPGAGTSTKQHSYKFEDDQVIEGMEYFYKLQDVSYDGETEFSRVISVNPKSTNSSQQAEEFGIMNCYPNPFNATVTIKYYVENSPANVKIYDINGQIIKKLGSSEHVTGQSTITWKGYDDQQMSVSSGVYFVHMINSRGQYDIKKLLLVR